MAKNKKNHPPGPVATPPALSASMQTLSWLGLGWAICTIYLYWQHFSWIAMMPQIPPLSNAPIQWRVFGLDAKALFLLATLLPGAAALGSYLLIPFHLTWYSDLEEGVFALGLGLGAVGYLIFALGLLHLFQPWVFWGLWVAGMALAWHRWFRVKPVESLNAWAHRINRWHTDHVSWWPHIALLWMAVGIACLMAFVPELFYDSMVYHLGVPNWYLLEGGIKYYPAIHAQFPFLRQMLNVLGLALSGERLAKLLHWSSAPLMIATYQVLARRYSVPKTTLIAALALLMMPMVNLNLWTAGIDVGMSAFALLCFLAWMNGLTDPLLRSRWFSLAGVLGGFCFSSKYPGLTFVACLCLSTLIYLGVTEKNWKAAFIAALKIGLIACLVTLPWLIKSWVFTGNPMYPYLFHWFKSRDLFPDRAFDFMSDTQSGAKSHVWDLLATPWTQTLTEISSFSAPGVFLLGFLGFLAVGLLRKEIRHKGYAAGALFFGLYWFMTNAMTDRIRVAIPGLAVGCYLLAHPAGYLYQRGRTFFRLALAGVVAIGALLGFLSMLPTLYSSYVPWDVLAGRESAEAYLSYTHPGLDPYPAMAMFEAAKQIIPPGHRMLIVGDEKTSLCHVPYLASGVHNNSILVQWSRAAQSEADLVKDFEDNQVSHVMLNVAETKRLSGYKILNWDDRSLAVYCRFFEKHLRLVKQVPIVERFFKQSTPVLLYEFSAQPQATPPSENILLELYEEFRIAPNDPLSAKKHIDILQAVDSASPGLINIREGLAFWRAQEAHSHAQTP